MTQTAVGSLETFKCRKADEKEAGNPAHLVLGLSSGGDDDTLIGSPHFRES